MSDDKDDDVRERIRQYQQRREDEKAAKERERLASGVCVVCGGEAKAVERYAAGELVFGGPPRRSYVDHYMCENCGLNYGKRPTGKISI